MSCDDTLLSRLHTVQSFSLTYLQRLSIKGGLKTVTGTKRDAAFLKEQPFAGCSHSLESDSYLKV
jgi:hypothetical protein